MKSVITIQGLFFIRKVAPRICVFGKEGWKTTVTPILYKAWKTVSKPVSTFWVYGFIFGISSIRFCLL